MEDQDIKRWMPLIDRGVNRHASSVPRQQKQDLRQECALELIRAEDKITKALARGDDHAARLVSRIVRTTLIDRFRRSIRQPQQASLSEPKIFRAAEKAHVTEAPTDKYHEQIGRAAEQLEDDERAVVELTMTEGLKAEEIAKRLGWSRRQVERLKASAVKRLKRILAR